MGDSSITEGLCRLLAGALGPDVTIKQLHQLGGGSSRENWAFEASAPSSDLGDCPLLLRRDPAASLANTDRATEVGLLRALSTTVLPTPVVVADDLSGALLGRPSVVLERAAGRADRSVLRDRDPYGLGADRRHELIVELCDLLVELHTLNPASTGLFDVFGPPAADPARAEVDRWAGELTRHKLGAQPELTYVTAWLEEHAPPPPPYTTLVHGDFRPANVLIHEGRWGTVLDWEFAHLGDPAEDVGWYTTSVYRNEHFGDDGTVCADDFVRRYTDHAGVAIEPARLHFWEVFALFKLGVIAVAGVDAFLNGGSDRVSAPAERILQLAVAEAIS